MPNVFAFTSTSMAKSAESRRENDLNNLKMGEAQIFDEMTPQNMEKLKNALAFNSTDNRNAMHSKFYDDEEAGSKYY